VAEEMPRAHQTSHTMQRFENNDNTTISAEKRN
jgi:hypothetical protein